jgi:hypothetical protein
MLFGEIDPLYCENHMKHTNTLGGRNAVLFFQADGIYSNHLDLKR